ncbi:hypothetical protein DTO271D3_4075 [Paecilomyces variotii]|nr:hypothetical protein DTO169E5_468 [Paecilomyces variotii]KAJ9315502.1 hypothetical protein DTO271D3_4075 [Paecilomyces variotii]
MSSPSTAKNELVLGLTASEAKILILGMVSTTDGKVDYQLLAQKGGYKTKDSAATVYNGARRKLLKLHGDSSASATTGGAKSKTLAANEGENDESTATPASKKGTPKRKKAAPAITGNNETPDSCLPTDAQLNDLDETPTPTPKRQRKKGTAVKVGSPKKTTKTAKVKAEETGKHETLDDMGNPLPSLELDAEDRALSADLDRFLKSEGN